MFNLFKKDEVNPKDNFSLIAITCLLIHSAKIDENFTENEREIIKKTLIEMGAQLENIDEIIKEAEKKEKVIKIKDNPFKILSQLNLK